jgi:methionyl-tRNA formyltransferase
MVSTIDEIENIKPIKQSVEGVVYATKLVKSEGEVDWKESAFTIDCKVRGMNPWPGVFFKYNG